MNKILSYNSVAFIIIFINLLQQSKAPPPNNNNPPLPFSYKVERAFEGDTIYFNSTHGCKQINATHIGTHECQCGGVSTLYWRHKTSTSNDLKCWYDLNSDSDLKTNGSFLGVTFIEDRGNGWHIFKGRKLEFSDPTAHNYDDVSDVCNSMKLVGEVDLMDHHGWLSTELSASNIFNIKKKSGSYILEINITSDHQIYAGQMIRILILCKKTNVENDFSLLLKFEGERVYRADVPVPWPTHSTSTPKTTPETTTISNNNEKSTKDDTNKMLIVGVVIAIGIIIILAIILVVLCLKRRRQSSSSSEKADENGVYQPPSYAYPNVTQTNPFSKTTNSFLGIPTKNKDSSNAPPVPRSPRPHFSTSSTAPLNDGSYVEMTGQTDQQYMPINNNPNSNEYGKLTNNASKADDSYDNYLDLNTQSGDCGGGDAQQEMYAAVKPDYEQPNVYEGLDNIQNSYMDLNNQQNVNNGVYAGLENEQSNDNGYTGLS